MTNKLFENRWPITRCLHNPNLDFRTSDTKAQCNGNEQLFLHTEQIFPDSILTYVCFFEDFIIL